MHRNLLFCASDLRYVLKREVTQNGISKMNKHQSITPLPVPSPQPVSFNSRKLSTLHCPFTQIYTALFIFDDLDNFFCLVGSQGFSNQTGFTEFPHTPGTPTLGEYSTPGPPPPLPYQSEQVSLCSTSALQHTNEKRSLLM